MNNSNNFEQPYALRLAEDLDECGDPLSVDAAAELRRLHDLNRQLTDKANRELIRNARLEEANQELLEALKGLLLFPNNPRENQKARAAIAKHGSQS